MPQIKIFIIVNKSPTVESMTVTIDIALIFSYAPYIPMESPARETAIPNGAKVHSIRLKTPKNNPAVKTFSSMLIPPYYVDKTIKHSYV